MALLHASIVKYRVFVKIATWPTENSKSTWRPLFNWPSEHLASFTLGHYFTWPSGHFEHLSSSSLLGHNVIWPLVIRPPANLNPCTLATLSPGQGYN